MREREIGTGAGNYVRVGNDYDYEHEHEHEYEYEFRLKPGHPNKGHEHEFRLKPGHPNLQDLFKVFEVASPWSSVHPP